MRQLRGLGAAGRSPGSSPMRAGVNGLGGRTSSIHILGQGGPYYTHPGVKAPQRNFLWADYRSTGVSAGESGYAWDQKASKEHWIAAQVRGPMTSGLKCTPLQHFRKPQNINWYTSFRMSTCALSRQRASQKCQKTLSWHVVPWQQPFKVCFPFLLLLLLLCVNGTWDVGSSKVRGCLYIGHSKSENC